MTLVAFVEISEPARIRMYAKHASEPPNAVIHSYSRTGFLLETDASLVLGSGLSLAFAEGEALALRPTWAGEGLYGCLFDIPVDIANWRRGKKAQDRTTRRAAPLPERRARDENLGAKIKRLRLQRGLRQDAVADAVGVSTASVSHWESGRAFPKKPRIADLARLFGVPDDELDMPSRDPSAVTGPDPGVSKETVESLRTQIADLLGVETGDLRIMVEVRS